MAFNRTNTQSNNQSNNQDQAGWKAQGFINLYLPTADGKRVKLGAIPLKESRTNEKTLLEWLNKDPANAQKLLAQMQIEFKSAEPKEGSGIVLPE
jgi:hypothetical protein